MYNEDTSKTFYPIFISFEQEHANNEIYLNDEVRNMQTKALKKKRIEELDIIKGITISLVCFRHINELTGLTTQNDILAVGLSVFFEPFMILFFLCSGYVYSSKGTVWKDILKRAKQLLLPFLEFGLFFTALYFVRYVIIDQKPLLWFDNTLTNFFGLTNWNVRLGVTEPNQMNYAFAPYWFVIELFTAFCLFIPIKKLTEKKHISVKVIATALLLGISMVLNHFDIQHTLENAYNSNVSFFFILINIFGSAGILMLGSILKEIDMFNLDARSNKFNILLAIICLVGDSVLVCLDFHSRYCLQYGEWGPYGAFSIPITAIDGLMLTYFMVFIAHYLKKVNLLNRVFSFLGKNSLYILMLHLGIAEAICWLGGFWHDVYHGPFPAEEFSSLNWVITVVGTAIFIGIFFAVKSLIKRNKNKKADNKTALS